VNRRGSALVSAIMVLVVIVGLVAALAPTVRVEVQSAGQDADNQRALYLARGGLNLALATLMQDTQTDQTGQTSTSTQTTPNTPTPNTDGLNDDWATLGMQGQNVSPLGEGQFRLEVVDASSRIDLNQADRQTLLRLPGIDETTVDQILAWRGQSGQNGANNNSNASSEDYESLPRPYRLKAAPFDSVEELLLVQGVTPLLLYGPEDGTISSPDQTPWIELLSVDTSSANTDSAGRTRVNLNTASAQQLLQGSQRAITLNQAQMIVAQRQRRAFTSLADLLSVGLSQGVVQRLVDHVTLTTGAQLSGKLNINTASTEALTTLLGRTMDPAAAEQMAEQIVQRRESNGDFTSVGDLLGLSQGAFRSLVDRVNTKSSTFLVRARGELRNGTVGAVEAWVRRDGQNAQVIRWRMVPRTPGWYDWGWDNGTGSRGLSSTSSTPHS
jgi:DNA uptake protein ComE-like DNA-binding protein